MGVWVLSCNVFLRPPNWTSGGPRESRNMRGTEEGMKGKEEKGMGGMNTSDIFSNLIVTVTEKIGYS